MTNFEQVKKYIEIQIQDSKKDYNASDRTTMFGLKMYSLGFMHSAFICEAITSEERDKLKALIEEGFKTNK